MKLPHKPYDRYTYMMMTVRIRGEWRLRIWLGVLALRIGVRVFGFITGCSTSVELPKDEPAPKETT